MATTSGTVAGFVELCEAIRNFVTSPRYDEVLGTGDGVTKSFSATLSNPTVAKGQCRLRFKIGGVWYECWDDGEGNFEHAKIVLATSSLTYATGALAVEFVEAIDDTFEIGVCYTDGAVEGQDWLPLLDQKTRDNANAEVWPSDDHKEVILKNSGVSYKEFICVGMREWKYELEQIWSMQFNLYHKYDKNYEDAATWLCNGDFTSFATYDPTREFWSELPHIPVKDDSMAYWISSNKRRIQVVVRITGTVYLFFYLGGGSRFASPSRYALPNIVIGPAVGARDYSHASNGMLVNAFAINQDGEHLPNASLVWLPFADHACPAPVKKTTNSKVVPYPISLVDNEALADRSDLFELDGIFWSLDKDFSTEDTLDTGDYLVFQNAYRTTYADYFAMKLE